jgi:uncharacterized membrane protein YhaH (DUF805 family)
MYLGNVNLGNLLFRFEGRINRAKYWLAVLIWFLVWAAVFSATFGLALIGSYGLMMWVVIIFLLLVPSVLSGVAIGIKRLHDRDKSGWWLLVFYLGPALFDALGRGTGTVGALFTLTSAAISIWGFVELGCLRGTEGPNTYGPDPLQADAAQPA